MKDYIFYNAKDNSIICGGVASREHGKLKAACKPFAECKPPNN